MAKAIGGTVLSDVIRLEQWDPDGDSYVMFRRPTRLDAERLAQMQAQSVIEWTEESQRTVRQRERVPWAILFSEMACLCLVECNIPEEESGPPLFIPGKTCLPPNHTGPIPEKIRQGFYRVWHLLPNELCEEIISKLMDFHPPFDWREPMRGED